MNLNILVSVLVFLLYVKCKTQFLQLNFYYKVKECDRSKWMRERQIRLPPHAVQVIALWPFLGYCGMIIVFIDCVLFV
jgi:hypothetical protein